VPSLNTTIFLHRYLDHIIVALVSSCCWRGYETSATYCQVRSLGDLDKLDNHPSRKLFSSRRPNRVKSLSPLWSFNSHVSSSNALPNQVNLNFSMSNPRLNTYTFAFFELISTPLRLISSCVAHERGFWVHRFDAGCGGDDYPYRRTPFSYVLMDIRSTVESFAITNHSTFCHSQERLPPERVI
jgi:hypothetical protein